MTALYLRITAVAAVFSSLALAQSGTGTTQNAPAAKTTTTQHRSAASKHSTTAKRRVAPKKKPAAPDPSKFTEPVAHIHTTAGDLTCKLFPKQAPHTVENFIGLSTGKLDWTDPDSGTPQHAKPLYNGTIFHRVIPNFMIQGGDPTGTGMGNPGYKFEDEFDPTLNFDQPGRLAMANSGPNTNGSQFFVTEAPTPWLNGHHTIFGQCDEASVELVKKIARMPAGENNRPDDPVKINDITFTDAAAPAAATAATKKPGAAAPKSGTAHHTTTTTKKKPAVPPPSPQ